MRTSDLLAPPDWSTVTTPGRFRAGATVRALFMRSHDDTFVVGGAVPVSGLFVLLLGTLEDGA